MTTLRDNFGRGRLVAQYHAQQRTVDLQLPIVFNKAEFPEFVHEETYA